jgi:DNA-binding transcriptional LysR family regulator
LNRLRRLFGDELFLRRPHGLEPTPRALELGPQIEQLIDAAETALAGARGFAPATSRRKFRIGAPDFLIALIAAPLVARVKRGAPQASLAFIQALGGTALEAVRRENSISRSVACAEARRHWSIRGCFATAMRSSAAPTTPPLPASSRRKHTARCSTSRSLRRRLIPFNATRHSPLFPTSWLPSPSWPGPMRLSSHRARWLQPTPQPST